MVMENDPITQHSLCLKCRNNTSAWWVSERREATSSQVVNYAAKITHSQPILNTSDNNESYNNSEQREVVYSHRQGVIHSSSPLFQRTGVVSMGGNEDIDHQTSNHCEAFYRGIRFREAIDALMS